MAEAQNTYRNVMIDIETLATGKDAVVLSIAAVAFDINPYTMKGDDRPKAQISPEALHIGLSVTEQIQMGRHVSDDTLAWWMQTLGGMDGSAMPDGEALPCADALGKLQDYLRKASDGFELKDTEFDVSVWCRGPQFDWAILEDLSAQYGVKLGVKYSKVFDTRTAGLFASTRERQTMEKSKAHNALEDCFSQIRDLEHVAATIGAITL